jgi:GH24 family phage-related lysozyme (muramidase)
MESFTNLSSGTTITEQYSPLIAPKPNSINVWYDNGVITSGSIASGAIANPISNQPTIGGTVTSLELSVITATALESDAVTVMKPMLSGQVTTNQVTTNQVIANQSSNLSIHEALPTRDPLTGIDTNALLTSSPIVEIQTAQIQTSGSTALPYPGYVFKYEPGKLLKFDIHVKQWQQRMKDRGWRLSVDGFYGLQSRRVTRQFQKEKGLTVDGIVGFKTWRQSFRGDNITGTISDPTDPIPSVGLGDPSTGATGLINQEGLDLIKSFEGFRSQAYRDPVGIWTIGYGHTENVQPGDMVSRAGAEDLLKADLRKFEAQVRRLVQVPLTSNQFSALVSFTYNVGSSSLARSTLLKLLNQQNYQGAANQFSRWNQAGEQVLPGLIRRRSAEKALFLQPASD